MNVRSCYEYMDSRFFRITHRIPAAIDIHFAGPGQPRNRRRFRLLGNTLNRLEISIGRNRETRFNDIHLQALELACQHQFVVYGHARAWGLFPVSQCCVENQYSVSHDWVLSIFAFGLFFMPGMVSDFRPMVAADT